MLLHAVLRQWLPSQWPRELRFLKSCLNTGVAQVRKDSSQVRTSITVFRGGKRIIRRAKRFGRRVIRRGRRVIRRAKRFGRRVIRGGKRVIRRVKRFGRRIFRRRRRGRG